MKHSAAFTKAFERTIGHEGMALSMDPEDRGNWTSGKCYEGELKGSKGGISAMTYPHLDIANLSYEEIAEIYWQDWWLALDMETWRPAVSCQLFDAAINHGFARAVKFLQQAAETTADGIIGPKTIAAVKAMDLNDVLLRFLSYRLDFMTQIRTWANYSRGWSRRIAENLRLSAEDN